MLSTSILALGMDWGISTTSRKTSRYVCHPQRPPSMTHTLQDLQQRETNWFLVRWMMEPLLERMILSWECLQAQSHTHSYAMWGATNRETSSISWPITAISQETQTPLSQRKWRSQGIIVYWCWIQPMSMASHLSESQACAIAWEDTS